jgi:hypothetical protein
VVRWKNCSIHCIPKCANVLVDENYTCLISDFGQSEIRAEAYRMSGICGSRKLVGRRRWSRVLTVNHRGNAPLAGARSDAGFE